MAQDTPDRKAGTSLPIESLVERAVDAWFGDMDLSEQSLRRMIEVSEGFSAFLDAQSVDVAESIEAGHCERFVKALLPGHPRPQEPSTATMHLRRATLRLLFRTARDLGLYEGDPTLDLALPPRTSTKARPLTEEEVALCRSFSLRTLNETRLPAAWALAEATARTSEIPHVTAADLDLDEGRVWIHGSSKAEPRWGILSNWGLAQVKRQVEKVSDPGRPIIYRGKGSEESKQAASCVAIKETLIRAGLGKEPDVRPASVLAWTGVRIFEETGRIEEVALRLGVRCLDRAARLIGFDWRELGEQA